MRRRVVLITGILLGLTIAGCVCTGSLEHALLYHPQRYPDGDWDADPKLFEDAWFESSDGTKLHGWFAEAAAPRAVVLFVHGNAGSIAGRRYVLALYRNHLSASILLFDYRGYGRSEGEPGEEGILADARAARRRLATRAGVAEQDVVLVGESLGGGIAVDLAARDGARGLVLENTFTSLPDVAGASLKPLPVRWLVRTRLDSLSKIGDYRGPLLQTHGDADRVIPYALGRRLFDAANEPKEFIRVPGGDHNDSPSPEYLAALNRFLGSLPTRP